MRHNLFLSMLAAALLGSGGASAAGTLCASDYTGNQIELGTDWQPYDKLVVDTPLTLTGNHGYLDLYNGATFEFQADNSGAICSIFTSEGRGNQTVYFDAPDDTYNFMFNEGVQSIIAASAGKAITLIEDLNKESSGFSFTVGQSPAETTLQLNGKGYGETVVLDGVSFTYVGPKDNEYIFKAGQIGFTGYENGSHALNLVVGGSVPEPTTGSFSLLALAGLAVRRRRK